jgi:F0F1-type ATP synthase assembly protein I
VDLRQLRERQELDNGLGTLPETVAVPDVCTVARRSRETCRRRPAVDSVRFFASTSYRRVPAAKGTMITAEKRDLDVAMTAPDDDRKRTEQSYLRYAGAGVEFFATIVVLTLLGVWLDGRFGTAPVLTIVLTFCGFAAATWNLIRSVLPPSRPPHERDEKP